VIISAIFVRFNKDSLKFILILAIKINETLIIDDEFIINFIEFTFGYDVLKIDFLK
jgi:hypothetical protein